MDPDGSASSTAITHVCGEGTLAVVAGSDCTVSREATEVSAQQGMSMCMDGAPSLAQQKAVPHAGRIPAANTVITARVRAAARTVREMLLWRR